MWDCVKFYRDSFPDIKTTEIRIGGIYASLRFDDPDFKARCKKYEVIAYKGVHTDAETFPPDYSLVMNGENNIDYQIVHSSRGCFRNCTFCGTWIIEPEFEPKKSIKNIIEPGLELGLKNLVFYDNNLLYNPYIKDILEEVIELKKHKKIGWCESQSGFDGKLLVEKPELAAKLKKAGFREPRIAWDWGYDKYPEIEKQIQVLKNAGYNRKDIYIFMIYNWKLDFEEMEKKRLKCYEWNVQISDCRNRPLTQLHDNYDPMKDQSNGIDYHINPNWTDAEVKQFRKNIRRQNICVRQNLRYHSKILENKKIFSKEQIQDFKFMPLEKVRTYLPDLWIPLDITPPKNKDKWIVEKIEYKPASPIFDTISSSDKIMPIIQMQ